MAYEFLETAMQCIPEYDGSHSTLEPFIEQVEFFARKLPAQESQKTLNSKYNYFKVDGMRPRTT